MNSKSLLSILALCPLVLFGCANSTPETGQTEEKVVLSNTDFNSASSLPAVEKTGKKPVQKPDPPKPLPKKEPPKLRKPDIKIDNFQRGTYLRDPHKKPEKNLYIERYGRARLDKAATIKRYAPITIMPVQLEAHCQTAWDRGKLHVRVAYLGPPHNLKVFMEETRMIYISFQDEAGSQIYNFEIPISQMQKAPDSMNFGMPTYQVEGQLPVALELYEQFFQWTCEWQ